MALSEQGLRTGSILAGKYRIDGVLGRGGMGTVYAAWHTILGTKVAIKVRRESARDQSSTARVLNEARALAALESEHVARVTDAGLLGSGEPYIVMEHLDGEDLAAVLARRQRLPLRDAIDYVFQALEGLAEAHGRGIVHRDIKPSNLFVARGRRGREILKILDFGISKREATPALIARNHQLAGSTATMGSGLLGTPAYMAPEQVHSPKSVDSRVDIWAIGVVLHELLVGARPFTSDPLAASDISAPEALTLRALHEGGAECPHSVAAVVERCLRVSADERYATVAELADALSEHIAGGAERVERIRAALERSLTLRATASHEDAAAQTAPTMTLEPSLVHAPAAPRAAEETRAAWGTIPLEEHTRRRPRTWLMGMIAIAAASLATFVLVARSHRAQTFEAHAADASTMIVASSAVPSVTSVDISRPSELETAAAPISLHPASVVAAPETRVRRPNRVAAPPKALYVSDASAPISAAPSGDEELDLFNRQ